MVILYQGMQSIWMRMCAFLRKIIGVKLEDNEAENRKIKQHKRLKAMLQMAVLGDPLLSQKGLIPEEHIQQNKP